MNDKLKSDFTLLPKGAKKHPAYPHFVEAMRNRAYGEEALQNAWVWFSTGWKAVADPWGLKRLLSHLERGEWTKAENLVGSLYRNISDRRNIEARKQKAQREQKKGTK